MIDPVSRGARRARRARRAVVAGAIAATAVLGIGVGSASAARPVAATTSADPSDDFLVNCDEQAGRVAGPLAADVVGARITNVVANPRSSSEISGLTIQIATRDMVDAFWASNPPSVARVVQINDGPDVWKAVTELHEGVRQNWLEHQGRRTDGLVTIQTDGTISTVTITGTTISGNATVGLQSNVMPDDKTFLCDKLDIPLALPLATPADAARTATPSTPSTAVPTSNAAPTAQPAKSGGGSSPLSAWIGALVAIALAAAGGFLWWYRRAKRPAPAPPAGTDPEPDPRELVRVGPSGGEADAGTVPADVPWAGDYWPTTRDSIDYRWDKPDESAAEKIAKAFGLPEGSTAPPSPPPESK